MSKCHTCGAESNGFYNCFPCRKKWADKKLSAVDQAIAEIGPINAKNLKAIQKRVTVLMREAKSG